MSDQPTCVWAEDGEDGPWGSSCGHYWQFTDGTPTENGMKFCPFCGKPLEQADSNEPGQDGAA